MVKKVKARNKGWAQSRADRIDDTIIREIVERDTLKGAAERAVGAGSTTRPSTMF